MKRNPYRGGVVGNPVDIAFDDRNNKSLIYIAEKANKNFNFKLSDMVVALHTHKLPEEFSTQKKKNKAKPFVPKMFNFNRNSFFPTFATCN
ncbi:MAG: hypothetical protein IPH34_13405 [Chitinophagaceae bacterium]|nr:hypothetical protein [Chitinophagaceae bacterium]